MLQELFQNKSLKPKERTEQLSKLLLEHQVTLDELTTFASAAKDPVKATCIESLEFATQANPGIVTKDTLSFIISALGSKAPRVKWESAKVIGNCIHLHPDKLEEAVNKLLINTGDEGTVVRWSAAFALSQILKLKTGINEALVPAAESIIAREEKNSIKKIYMDALKKIKSAKE